MTRFAIAAILALVGAIAEADGMSTQTQFCERLAAAPSAKAELAVLETRSELAPPDRAVRYAIRRTSDGAVLRGDEFTPAMFDDIEVVLHCADGGADHAIVWKPKGRESLEMLLRE